jgi:hypothetical protein
LVFLRESRLRATDLRRFSPREVSAASCSRSRDSAARRAGVEQVGDERVFHSREMQFHFRQDTFGVGEEDEPPVVLTGALVGFGEGDEHSDEGEEGED